MKDKANSIVINKADNVATAVVELRRGDLGRYITDGGLVEVLIMQAIPQYHKFAICNISENEPVRKYGEIIGRAITSIVKGTHVHVHNIHSPGGEKG